MAAFPKPDALEIDLQELLEDVSQVLRPFVDKTNYELSVVACSEPISLVAVELQLRQVLVNLVFNAVQAGEGPTVQGEIMDIKISGTYGYMAGYNEVVILDSGVVG